MNKYKFDFEFICDWLQWTASYGQAKAGRPARTYIQQLCADQDVALKIYREQWMIETGGEKVLGRSVLAACHNDVDDIWLLQYWLWELKTKSTNSCFWMANFWSISMVDYDSSLNFSSQIEIWIFEVRG